MSPAHCSAALQMMARWDLNDMVERMVSGLRCPLLLVAAVSLLILGGAALTNTLWRRPEHLELEALAWSDGLTGLANRRRLDHDLKEIRSAAATPALQPSSTP